MIDWVVGATYLAVVTAKTAAAWRKHASRGGRWLGPGRSGWLLARRCVECLEQGVWAGGWYGLAALVVLALLVEYAHLDRYVSAGGGVSEVLAVAAASMVVVVSAKALGVSTLSGLPVCLLAQDREAQQQPTASTSASVVLLEGAPAQFRLRLGLPDCASAAGRGAGVVLLAMLAFALGWTLFALWALGLLLVSSALSVTSTVGEAVADGDVVRGRSLLGLRSFEYAVGDLRISYQRVGWPSRELLVVTRLAGWPVFFSSRGEGYSRVEQRILARVIGCVAKAQP